MGSVIHCMQHLIVEVGYLHVLQSGLSRENTSLSAQGGILGEDRRVRVEREDKIFLKLTS